MNKFIVNLDSIRKNLYNIQKLTKAEIAAVVKSDCYGLGIEKVVPILIDQKIKTFFVATYNEALKLKKITSSNIIIKIFIIQGLSSGNVKNFIKNNFIPVINSVNELDIWNNASKKLKKNLVTSINIDTGMGRMGLSIKEFQRFCKDKDKLYNRLTIELVMSHLSYADDPNHFYHKNQLERFISITRKINCKYSLSASGGVYLGKDYHFDVVRVGASLFGTLATKVKNINLINPVKLISKIIHIKKLEYNSYIGYNCNYKANSGDIIATIPIGYAHGYPKSCGNKSSVFIGGYRVPVVGNISMELTTLDISSIPIPLQRVDQEVEIIGPNYDIENLSFDSGISDNEIILALSNNCKREWINNKNSQ